MHYGVAALVSGLLLLGVGAIACGTAAAAKWLVVGRITVSEHPLWSSFVWRNELSDAFVETVAAPWFANAATGTPILNLWLRLLGARIGRGVWCETYWLPEADLVSLGDGATVQRGCVVQTHLFHDRVMAIDRVTLDAGATLGPHCVALPRVGGLGESATVGPASLVMRGDVVPARTPAGRATPHRTVADGKVGFDKLNRQRMIRRPSRDDRAQRGRRVSRSDRRFGRGVDLLGKRQQRRDGQCDQHDATDPGQHLEREDRQDDHHDAGDHGDDAREDQEPGGGAVAGLGGRGVEVGDALEDPADTDEDREQPHRVTGLKSAMMPASRTITPTTPSRTRTPLLRNVAAKAW